MSYNPTIPRELEDDEIIHYISRRYHKSPAEIISRYIDQERKADSTAGFVLEDNEMEILRAMGIQQILR